MRLRPRQRLNYCGAPQQRGCRSGTDLPPCRPEITAFPAFEEVLTSIRQEYGLDKPLIVQLGIYLGNLATGDLGYSFFFNQPVASLIAQRIGPTILLVITAQILPIVIGFVSVFAAIGYAVPVFWTGIMLIILFASVWPIFPNAWRTGWRSCIWARWSNLAPAAQSLKTRDIPTPSVCSMRHRLPIRASGTSASFLWVTFPARSGRKGNPRNALFWKKSPAVTGRRGNRRRPNCSLSRVSQWAIAAPSPRAGPSFR